MPFDPINPLSAIGASNDPSLTARTTANNAGAIELQNALGKLAAGGQNDRRLAGINNESLEFRDLARLGLSNRGSGAGGLQEGLEQIRSDNSNTARAKSFNDEASAMGILARDTGFRPNLQSTAGETASRINSVTAGLPTSVLAAMVNGSQAAEATAKVGQERKSTTMNIGGVPVAGEQVVNTDSSERGGKIKGDPDLARIPFDAIAQDNALRKMQSNPKFKRYGIVRLEKDANGQTIGIDAEGNEYDLTNTTARR
jgi:hypothetical protein